MFIYLQVDVIVNTCAPDFKLSSRQGLPKTISDAAGSALQSEIDSRYPNGIKIGDIAVTNGYSLKCRKIYHGCLSPFFGKGTADQLPEKV